MLRIFQQLKARPKGKIADEVKAKIRDPFRKIPRDRPAIILDVFTHLAEEDTDVGVNELLLVSQCAVREGRREHTPPKVMLPFVDDGLDTEGARGGVNRLVPVRLLDIDVAVSVDRVLSRDCVKIQRVRPNADLKSACWSAPWVSENKFLSPRGMRVPQGLSSAYQR